jgi:citrate lyase subunit beta/citryl-CoA lyase
MRPDRSYLYVPAGDPDQLSKALDSAADAVIVDLADAVAPEAKDAAREAVRAWLLSRPSGRIWVRINPGEIGHLDARAVVTPALAGLFLSGTPSATVVAALGADLAEAEESLGLPIGHVPVVPVIETAQAILDAAEIARAPRVARLTLGEARLCAELGVVCGPDERELLVARTQIVLVSAAARVGAPIGSSDQVADPDAFAASTTALLRLGFRGRACVDATQAAMVNEIFA